MAECDNNNLLSFQWAMILQTTDNDLRHGLRL